VVVAIILGIETKSLLVGEGVSDEMFVHITDAILAGPEAQRIVHIKTLYLGPEEVLVAAKLAFSATLPFAQVAAGIDSIEKRIRERVPEARVIYLEPDVDRGDPKKVSTDAIVIKGTD
jgi:divalent metal cation (Fe/Co/Zn/Cd) transporter